ncbi:MAG: hypothetical protein JXL80_16390 [Planctomycetes bacterium]|nr:hypothetical protein [Planctomycetota bacterium]
MQRIAISLAVLAGVGLLLAAAPAGAAEYYLDAASGNDGNTGTASAPWRTWTRAQQTLAAGDTLNCTGASGIFYHMTGGRLYLLADDEDHVAVRNTTGVWRLDADPENVYFTPSGTGDSTHTDCISIMGPVRNVVIERNSLEVTTYAAQAVKLDYVSGHPQEIVLQNNLFFSRTASPAYLLLMSGGIDCVFRHNIVYPGPNAPLARGIRFLQKDEGPWQNLQFYNNIISGAVFTSGVPVSDYNCWMSAPPASINEGAHSFTVSGVGAVGFVDSASSDFHLRADAAVRDQGNPAQAPGVTTENPEGVDYDGLDRGATPDTGPYEYRVGRPRVRQWASIAEHGAAGAMAMVVADQDVDPRAAVSGLRVDFDRALDPATVGDGSVTVVGQSSGPLTLDLGALVLSNGSMTLTIVLPSNLGDDVWTITLSESVGGPGGALDGDRDLVLRRLAGDVDSSGAVTAADVLALRDHAGEAVAAATCRWDVDLSGQITPADLQAARTRIGNSLP